MIQTIRDAESKIGIIQRDIGSLRAKLNELENQLNEVIKTKPSQSNGEVKINDWILSSDGSEISHRLNHKFASLNVNTLIAGNAEIDNLTVTEDLEVDGDLTVDTVYAEEVDIRSNLSISKFHISNDLTEQGFHILNYGADSFILSGCKFNGTNWIAVNTSAVIISMSGVNGFAFYANTGLTVGASFSPNSYFNISGAGILTLYGYNANEFMGTDGSKNLIGYTASAFRTAIDVYSKSEVDTLLAAKANTGSYSVSLVSSSTHTHAGTAPADGIHTHTGSVTI